MQDVFLHCCIAAFTQVNDLNTSSTFSCTPVLLISPSAAVLVLYFKYFLRWDDDFSTTIYHTFVALCYLSPILGAIVADSWLGKFK